MDISQVISEEEYNNTKALKYDQFNVYITRLVKLCVEEALKTIPQVATHMAAHATYMKKLNTTFYKDNKDLVNHKPLVASAMEKVQGENPGMSYEEVMAEAAVRARKIIPTLSIREGKGLKDLKLFDDRLKDI